MPDSEEIIRATRFEDAMSESVPPAVEEQGDEREEFACELCGKLILVPGRSYEIAPEAVCRCPTVPKSLLIAKQQQADRQNRRAENAEAALTTERHRTEVAEGERDEARRNEGALDAALQAAAGERREAERLREALRIATEYLAEAVNGYKIERSAAWLKDNGFYAETPPAGSLAAIADEARASQGET